MGTLVLPSYRRWLFSVLSGLAAVGARAALAPLLGEQVPFGIAFPVTVLAGIFWGAGPAALTALVCAGLCLSGWVSPDLSARPTLVGVFLLTSVLFALVADHAARLKHAGKQAPETIGAETELTAWLRAVLAGSVLLPLLAFVGIAWWGYQRARHEAEATVTHAAQMAQEQARDAFDIAAKLADRADSVSATMQVDDEARMHQRLADIAYGLPFVLYLTVWDEHGHPLARSDIYPSDPATTIADRDFFQRLGGDRTGKAIVSELIVGRQSHQKLTNFAIRRSSPDGSFRGVVAVSLAPSFFTDFYRGASSDRPMGVASYALVRIDGDILASWPSSSEARTVVGPDSPSLAAIRRGEAAGLHESRAGADQAPRLIAFRRVEGRPLYVVAGVSGRAMYASWLRFVALLAAVLLPTTAGLVYVSWVALKKTQRETQTALELQDHIQRRASAERSMLQSQKLETLAVVTAGVAHDFNNLLAIVGASLHVHKRKHPELAHDKQVEAMVRSVQSGVRLTRQLLSFTRKQAMRAEIVELQTWLPSIEGLVQTTPGPNISWRCTVESDTSPVLVDAGELELAIINLVVNARHAMPAGGSLALRAGNAPVSSPGMPALVDIAVSDSGVGIPQDLIAKVTEPFFTTREKGVGSGLGLTQVQGFCTQSGGRLEITSTEGAGTTVRIFLPAQAAAAPSPPVLEVVEESLAGFVLLVEDNIDVAATTADMLAAAGLEVARASSAADALAYLAASTRTPDAVLSDIAMPGSMNGIELAFALRKSHPALPVLLTTGYTEHLQEALAGGLRVLQKPSSPEEILAELRALMRGGRKPS